MPAPRDDVRILIVDDHPANLVALEAALSHLQCEIVQASSGSEAAKFLREREFAVVLLDVQMPGMDGFETAQAIRRQEEGTARRTPILFVTANVYSEEMIRKGYWAGAVDFLFKPLDLDILRYKISGFVDLFKSRRDAAELEALRHESVTRDRFNDLEHVLEGAKTGLWDWDVKSDTLVWTGYLPSLFGLKKDEFPKTFSEYQKLLHPSDRDQVAQAIQSAIDTDQSFEIEHRVDWPDGSEHWIYGKGKAFYANDGSVYRMAGSSVDVTEQKRAREAREQASQIARSEAFLDSLIENLPNMVFVKDAKTLRFVRFNKAGELLLGVPRAQLIGKDDYDFFPKEQADFFTANDRAVLAGYEIVDIPEESIRAAHGERILHTRKIPIFGVDGRPAYLLGISEDITEQKNAEKIQLQMIRKLGAREAREAATQRMAFLAETSTLLASSLDYRETLSRLSEKVLPYLGDWCSVILVKGDQRTLDRVAVSHRLAEKAPYIDTLCRYMPADLSESRSISHVVSAGGPIFVTEVTDDDLKSAARDADHLEAMMQLGSRSCIVTPIRSGEKVLGAISFCYGPEGRKHTPEDLSFAEELGRRVGIGVENALLYEAAQKAIRIRDEFLSIASHELKTPITSLKLQLQMTRRATKPEQGLLPTPEKLARVLDVATAQVDRLTSLVDDLLDVSRIESGKLSYQFEFVELGQLVSEMVERFEEQSRAANSALKLVLREPVQVRCDRFRMEQVVVNLLSNALKYGAGSPVEVSVQGADYAARITVSDHGMGIPSDKIDQVFERFERAISPANISGLGLGLYISREIIRAHQGEIHVKSELGKGSEFTVELPSTAREA